MIRNFRFQSHLYAKLYACRPLASNSDHPGHGSVASADCLAVPLTALVCFSLPTHLAADTSPHWMTPERSVRCFSWFATREAKALKAKVSTHEAKMDSAELRLKEFRHIQLHSQSSQTRARHLPTSGHHRTRPALARLARLPSMWISSEWPVIRPQLGQVGLELSDFQQPDFWGVSTLQRG